MVNMTGLGLQLLSQGMYARGQRRQQERSREDEQLHQRDMEKQRQLYQTGLIQDQRTYEADREKAEAERQAGIFTGMYAPQYESTGIMQPTDPALQDIGYSPQPDFAGGETEYEPVMEATGLYSQLRPETQAMIDAALEESNPFMQAGMFEQLQPMIDADRQEAIASEGLSARMNAYQMMSDYESPDEFFNAISQMDISGMTGTELAGFVGAFDPIIGAEIMTRLTTMGQMGVEQAELGMTATRAGIANTRANTAYTRARMDMLGSTGGGSGYGGSGSGGSDNASGTITNDEMNRAFVEGGFGVIQDGRPVFNLGYGNNQATWAAVRDWARNNPAIPLTAEEEQAAEWSAFNDILAQVRDLAGGDYLLIPGIIDDLLASGAITQEQADELMYYSGQ